MHRMLPVVALLVSACTPFGSFMVRPLDVPVSALPDSSVEMVATDGERVWQQERAPAQQQADVVRFVAVGDLGMREDVDRTMPHPYARRLADLAEVACDRQGGCDFSVWLGDNVGPAGIQGPAGRAFLTDLALHWRNMGPIYTVLGDKDWGPVFASQRRARRELEWVHGLEQARDAREPNALDVRGDAHFWNFRTGLIDVHGIDTTYLVRRCRLEGEQIACSNDKVAEGDVPVMSDVAPLQAIGRDAGSRWNIVLGHHPYLSSGAHGDAGYLRTLGMPIWPGEAFEAAMDEYVVGRADLYLSAHDKGVQFTSDAGPRRQQMTGLGIAGTGSEARGRRADAERISEYEDPGEIGLTLVEATPEMLTVRFYTLANGAGSASFVSCRNAGANSQWRQGEAACRPPVPVAEEPEMVVEAD